MKLTKLNTRGFSHHLIMVVVVLVTAIGGAYTLVASHAATAANNHLPTGNASLDTCNASVSGQEIDQDRGGDGARVIVSVDGNKVKATGGSANYAYSIPTQYRNGQNHIVSVYGENVNTAAQDNGTNPDIGDSTYNSANCPTAAPAPVAPTAPATTHQAPTGTASINVCGGTISGTEVDPDRPNDGARLVEKVDVTNFDQNSASHNYSFSIIAGAHHVDVSAKNVGTDGGQDGPNVVIGSFDYNTADCSTPPPTTPPAPTTNNKSAPTGTASLDYCSGVITGSETDQDRNLDGARVIVAVSGNKVVATSGAAPYSYTIPATYRDGKAHTVSVYGQNVDTKASPSGTNPDLGDFTYDSVDPGHCPSGSTTPPKTPTPTPIKSAPIVITPVPGKPGSGGGGTSTPVVTTIPGLPTTPTKTKTTTSPTKTSTHSPVVITAPVVNKPIPAPVTVKGTQKVNIPPADNPCQVGQLWLTDAAGGGSRCSGRSPADQCQFDHPSGGYAIYDDVCTSIKIVSKDNPDAPKFDAKAACLSVGNVYVNGSHCITQAEHLANEKTSCEGDGHHTYIVKIGPGLSNICAWNPLSGNGSAH